MCCLAYSTEEEDFTTTYLEISDQRHQTLCHHLKRRGEREGGRERKRERERERERWRGGRRDIGLNQELGCLHSCIWTCA